MNEDKEEITVENDFTIRKPVKKSSKIKWKIDIDEAVSYGFNTIGGIIKYVGIMILMVILISIFFRFSIEATLAGDDVLSDFFTFMAYISLVVLLLIYVSLSIGLLYKFGGDILLKAVETHNRFAYKLRQRERKEN